MINSIIKVFGLTPKKEVDNLRIELAQLRQDMLQISNILGKLAAKVDKTVSAARQNSATIETLARHQAELTLEFISMFDGLQTVSSKKNIGIGFSTFGSDDDDDLLN
ncbi:hypothetical protein OAA09_00630 [bacterium]|nr:hypothetical protein [bacterium]